MIFLFIGFLIANFYIENTISGGGLETKVVAFFNFVILGSVFLFYGISRIRKHGTEIKKFTQEEYQLFSISKKFYLILGYAWYFAIIFYSLWTIQVGLRLAWSWFR